VMTSHIKFPKIDPEFPVTLSEKFLKGILREELRYRNLIVSDDLDMMGVAKDYRVDEIPVRAFQAGCDMLLYCNKHENPPIAIEAMLKAAKEHKISAQQIDESYNRVVALKKDVLKKPDPEPFDKVAGLIGHADHQRLAQAIKDGAVPADLLKDKEQA